MQTNLAVEQSKIIRWPESPWNQSGRKRKGLWRKGFAEEPSLEFSYLAGKFSSPLINVGIISLSRRTRCCINPGLALTLALKIQKMNVSRTHCRERLWDL